MCTCGMIPSHLVMKQEKCIVDAEGNNYESDPVVQKVEKRVMTEYWCRNCGGHFKGFLAALGGLRLSGKGILQFEKCNCPKCRSSNTLPYVEPGSVTVSSSLDELTSIEYYVEALKYAEKQ